MNGKKRSVLILLGIVMLAALTMMAGCSGSDGSNGANGATGPAGPSGVAPTDYTCVLCHNNGKIADITPFHPTVTNQLAISNIQVSSSATGTPVVTFHVDTVNNLTGAVVAPYTTMVASQVRAYIADLVPANTVTSPTGTLVSNLTGTLSTPYFALWAYDSGKPIVNNGSGDYSYTFSTLWGAPTNTWYNTAVIDTTVATGHTQRVLLRAAPVSGDISLYGTAATADFKVPANGASATILADQRLLTTIATCQKCHSTKMLGAAHANGYMDTKACVICHSPLYASTNEPAGFMAELQADFPEFIHKIHAAKAVEGFPTRIKGNGYVDVTYPQDIKKCDVCHTGTGDMGNNFKNHPTRIACASCHDTIDFAGGSFVGLDGVTKTHDVVTDDNCSGCHTATNTANNRDIVYNHRTTPATGSANDPEFTVNLALSAPANGTNYVSKETLTVTVTLTDRATGNPVAGTVYTAAKDAAGTSGGGLSTASLYIYGPRAKALPLTGKQANSLFTGGTDAKVKTDATGFKYVMTIPSTVTKGTYGVRFRAGDYGRVSDTNYRIESTKFTKIQIGTDVEEAKIDGDACVNCHGAGTAPFHDARHAVVFDTDECVSCHDLSGGHADPISNRVHAVHAQSVHGDLLDTTAEPLDWSSVSYSMGNTGTSTSASTLGASTGAKICVTCHTSGNTAYLDNALGQACYGCHADNSLSLDHMVQMGAPAKE